MREKQRLEDAIARVYRQGRVLTRDQGGSASTDEFVATVRAAL
jgi:isocitrate/isopropylmalate dehydrogenase